MSLNVCGGAMVLILAIAAAVAAAAEAGTPTTRPAVEARFMTNSTRQPLCDALAAWSLQTGRSYCYSAALPDGPVVADEPGREIDLAEVLRGLGWRMVQIGGGGSPPADVVLAIVRDGEEEKVAALRKTLLESADESDRRTAAYALGRLTVPSAVAALVEGLADKRPAVQFQCLEAIWAIESDFDMRALPGRVSMFKVAPIKPNPLVAVVTSAVEDKPRRAWRYAVALLGRAETPVVSSFAMAGLDEADPRVRLTAARALRQSASGDYLPALGEFAKASTDWAARRQALGALARFPALPRLLESINPADVLNEELLACAYEALGVARNEAGLPLLAHALRAGNANLATHAAEALGRIGTAQAEQALIETLAAKEDWRRAAAADGLAVPARQQPPKATEALIGLRKDPSPAVRAAAIRALGVIGGENARKAVLDFSKDDNAQIRLAAARALRRTGGAAALARLNELATDPDAEVKRESLHGLGWLGGVNEADKLAAIAKDRSLGREGADGALVGLGDLLPPAARDIAIRTLLELMDDPATCPYPVGRSAVALNDPRLLSGLLKVQSMPRGVGSALRVDCMDAIGGLATKQTTEALAKNWWEYDNMPRYQGGRALRENLARGEVTDTLLALLHSTGDTQTAAAFSLANSRDPRAVAGLIELLTSRKGDTLGAAVALGQISDPAATDALLAAAGDPTHPARHAAGRALRMRDLAWQPAVKKTLIALYGWREDGTPPPIEEQKPNTWVLRRFNHDYDDMSISELTYESAAAYDSRRGRVFQWGAHGKRYDSPQTGETWVYDPAANTWEEKGLRELPPGTCMTRQICYDSTNDRLIVRGGSGGGHGWLFMREQRIRNSSPWAYDPQNDRWIPMRPAALADFSLTHLIAHDPQHGVVIGLGRLPVPTPTTKPVAGAPKPPPPTPTPVIIAAYDTYRNQWTRPVTQPEAPTGAFTTIAYDNRRGRMLFAGDGLLWSYSLADNTWTDLKPTTAPADGQAPAKGSAPMVYDSVNDVALLFRAARWESKKGTAVFAYDPAKNEWTSLTTAGMQPDYAEWDAAFDEQHNVVVVCGGEITSCPGSPNCRETWTYRHGPGRGERALAGPGMASATVVPNGVRVTWEAAPDGRVAGYLVSRTAGDQTWGLPAAPGGLVPLNGGKPVQTLELIDPVKPSGTVAQPGPGTIYVIQSVGAKGVKSIGRAIARTQPPIPVGVVATWRADKKVRVAWEKSAAVDVVGYNIYRAAVTVASLNSDNPVKDRGPFVKVNPAPVNPPPVYPAPVGVPPVNGVPVSVTEFVDPLPASQPDAANPLPTGWVLPPRVYAVRAVNALGVESGLSAWVLTIPDSPKRIEARRRDDGSVVVRWEPDPNPNVAGYVVYRMDNWRNNLATRVNPVPVPATMLIDPAWGPADGSRPAGERQRYWVVAVDRQGQEGPSGTGAWTFNR